jgi:haloalkane dehalogenase
MGDSDKLSDRGPKSYSFVEHRKYLDALLEEIGVTDKVTFVIHDWGSALGFDWAFRNPDKVKGIVYMEALLFHYDWSDWPKDARKIFQGFRSPAGENLIGCSKPGASHPVSPVTTGALRAPVFSRLWQ